MAPWTSGLSHHPFTVESRVRTPAGSPKVKGDTMKHIVSFSGGKDSTAMLLKMLENNMQIDEIIYCDTGKEFPQMYDHIEKVKFYIKEKYNKTITILKSEKTFDYFMFEHIKTRGKNKGQAGYGWPSMRARWCTTYLKTVVLDKYLKKYKEEGYVEYIGIAYDELDRVKDKKYPLVEWQMTEKDCLDYCFKNGWNWIENGIELYSVLDRVSCWCCRNKNLKELKNIYNFLPNYWEKLRELQKKIDIPFRNKSTIFELENQFKNQSLTDKISR